MASKATATLGFHCVQAGRTICRRSSPWVAEQRWSSTPTLQAPKNLYPRASDDAPIWGVTKLSLNNRCGGCCSSFPTSICPPASSTATQAYHALAEVADCDHLYCMLLGLWYGLHLPTSPTAATHIPHLNITVMLARCCTCWVSIPPNLKFSPKSHILRLSAWVLRNCHFGSPNEQQKRPPSPTRCLDFPSGLCLELRNPLALLQQAT